MNIYSKFITVLLLASMVEGCSMIGATPTPLPGWRSPVYELLVEDSNFPQGWIVEFPQNTSIDPTANHVWRIWSHISGAKAEQAIWRAYSIEDAQAKYEELQRQFQPSRPSEPDAIFIELKPPTSISFQSQVADEMHIACGWVYTAYCIVVARYNNYVTDIRMDLESEHEGLHSSGLTLEQIESIVIAMDKQFQEFTNSQDTSTAP